MSSTKNTNKKHLLASPVNRFCKCFPSATEDRITALSELEKQYTGLKKQLKDKQNQRKKTSRQIGEAKQNAQPVDSLKCSVKQQSTAIDNLQTELHHLADKILGYFETDNIADSDESCSPPLPPGRTHNDQPVSKSKLTIKQLTDNEIDEWNHYVESNPAASIYHRAEWKELIKNIFGHHTYYFYARYNNDIAGILPLVRLKSRLFGDFMVSMPYFNAGGAIANSLSVEHALMQAANNHANKLGVEHIEYRDDIHREALPVRTEKVNMILALPATHDDLWQRFPSKLRSQIRRALREKTEICIGGKEYLDEFYTVFARNMRDLGTPVYSKSFFNKILRTFAENSKIIVVRFANRPVAAAFLLGYKNTLEIPWASTIKDVNHLSMNMLLYWEVLKFAIKNRYQYFDFGRSSKDASTYNFKQQWGAKPKQLYWHYWLKNNAEMPSLNPNNPKYKLVINIWKKLPVRVTRYIGPNIVKNLP